MVVASDPTLDRTKDVMRPEGCILDNYHENNIVLANHDPTQPIGNAKAAISNGRVEALIDFAPAGISAKADEYCGLAKAGVLRAVSVGFDPIEYEPNKAGGLNYNKWELMELSLVAVPANPGARIIARAAQLDPVEVPRAKDAPVLNVKGMYGLACLASILDDLGYLQSMTAYEAENGSRRLCAARHAWRSHARASPTRSSPCRRRRLPNFSQAQARSPTPSPRRTPPPRRVSFIKAFAASARQGGARFQRRQRRARRRNQQGARQRVRRARPRRLNLHGKLNDALTEAQGHQADAAEHAKALFEAGKKPDPDEDPEADEDDELAFAAAQRKRRAAVIALRA